MAISLTGGATLNLSALQPPSLTTIPAFMQAGHWRFTFTQTSSPGGGLSAHQTLFCVGSGSYWDDLYIHGNGASGTTLELYIGTSNYGGSPAITYSNGQPVTVELDWPNSQITISGATTGNGTFSTFTLPAWPSGSLGVGRNTSGLTELFSGTLSNVYSLDGPKQAGMTGAGVGSIMFPNPGTGAGAQAGLIGAGAGALRIASAGAGQLAPIAGAGSQVDTRFSVGTAVQAGLTGAGVGAMRIAGAGVGVQAGLAGAASGANPIASDAAGTQASLVALGIGAFRIAGVGLGVQPGLVGDADAVSGRYEYLGDDGLTLYPRRGETYPDANGFLIGAAGAYVPDDEYAAKAVMRGDLLTSDPYEFAPDLDAGPPVAVVLPVALTGTSSGSSTTSCTLSIAAFVAPVALTGTSSGSSTTSCTLAIGAPIALSGNSSGASTTSMFAILGTPAVLVSLQTLNAANLIEPGKEANLGFRVENQTNSSKTVSISYNLTTIDGTVTGYSTSITVGAKSSGLSVISLSGALFGHRWVDFSASWSGGSQGSSTKAFHYGHAAGQIADTIGFAWGMNLGFNAIPNDYVCAQILGCDHIRTNYEWGGIESSFNSFNWSAPDEIIRMNEAHNFRTMWIAAYNAYYDGAQFGVPNTSHYTNFLTKMCQRYGTRIWAMELWNEPDNTNFWTGSAAQYLTLMQAGYAAVKAVNSSIKVISGGNAGWNTNGWGLPDALYISDMESTILANTNYFDYYGYHPHGDLNVLEADLSSIGSLLSGMSPVKPLFYNETGRSTTGETAFLRENQAIESIKKLTVSRASAQPTSYTAYEMTDSGTNPSDDEQHWGFLTNDRQPKPSFGMTCEFIRLTKNLPFYGVLGSLDPDGRFYIFGSVALGFVSIFWNQTGGAISNRSLNVGSGAKLLDYQANVTASPGGTTQTVGWTRNPQYLISAVAPT